MTLLACRFNPVRVEFDQTGQAVPFTKAGVPVRASVACDVIMN